MEAANLLVLNIWKHENSQMSVLSRKNDVQLVTCQSAQRALYHRQNFSWGGAAGGGEGKCTKSPMPLSGTAHAVFPHKHEIA